jgi:hypothetical protein
MDRLGRCIGCAPRSYFNQQTEKCRARNAYSIPEPRVSCRAKRCASSIHRVVLSREQNAAD